MIFYVFIEVYFFMSFRTCFSILFITGASPRVK